ncbi:hypothetical protein ACQR1W_27110 [Bradyrhizobium sp. HKCCYLS1011]|uniref:hypothetical protein n=1 Tax=Bradyrhizobium sp. HKCCYLS1011 TaxID=3420733 RepID=UPI003EB734C2
MDWLQFIAAVIGHLAWPVVFLIVIFVIRSHLGSLAERILELSFGGATLKFDKLLSKGAELIEEAPKPKADVSSADALRELPKLDRPDGDREISRLDIMLMTSDARREVNELLGRLSEEMGIDKIRNPRILLRMLGKRGAISQEVIELYFTLESAQEAAFREGIDRKEDAVELLRQSVFLKLALQQALTDLRVKRS